MADPTQKPDKPDQYERFTALLVASQPTVMGFIYSLVPATGDAEDILQKTCLIAWQKFDQFDETTRFSTWACQIAYFEVKNYLRTKARDRHVFSDEVLQTLADEHSQASDRLAEEHRAALTQCIKTLGTDQRELLRRCYRAGSTVQEVARLIERTANSVYKQLSRIRRRLLACITQRLEQGGPA